MKCLLIFVKIMPGRKLPETSETTPALNHILSELSLQKTSNQSVDFIIRWDTLTKHLTLRPQDQRLGGRIAFCFDQVSGAKNCEGTNFVGTCCHDLVLSSIAVEMTRRIWKPWKEETLLTASPISLILSVPSVIPMQGDGVDDRYQIACRVNCRREAWE